VPNCRFHQVFHEPHENAAWSKVRGINFIIASTQAGTEVALMTTDLDTTGPEERKSIWLGIGKFLFVVVLAVIFLSAWPKHGASPLL
jgi:hypothetical protein